MKILKIAIYNIAGQKFSYGMIGIVIGLVSFCLFVGNIIYSSMYSGIKTACNRIGADIIIVSDEYAKALSASLFRGKASTFIMNADILGEIENCQKVKEVSGQLFIATLSDSPCCENSIQLIAINPETDFSINSWVYHSIKELKENEIIIGNLLGKKRGETVQYFGKEFTVINVLDETGMGYDNSAFISQKAAQEIADNPIYKNSVAYEKAEYSVSMILVNVIEDSSNEEALLEINKVLADKGATAYVTSNMLKSKMKDMKSYLFIGLGYEGIILLICGVAVFSILANLFYMRKKEIGSMLTIGFGKAYIRKVFCVESLIVSVIAVSAGNVAAYFLTNVFHYRMRTFLEMAYQKVSFQKMLVLMLSNHGISLCLLIIALLLVFSQFKCREISEMIGSD